MKKTLALLNILVHNQLELEGGDQQDAKAVLDEKARLMLCKMAHILLVNTRSK